MRRWGLLVLSLVIGFVSGLFYARGDVQRECTGIVASAKALEPSMSKSYERQLLKTCVLSRVVRR